MTTANTRTTGYRMCQPGREWLCDPEIWADQRWNPDNPLGSHSGESRNPAMKNAPQAGKTKMLSHIRGKLFNYLDTGFRRYDVILLMDYPG